MATTPNPNVGSESHKSDPSKTVVLNSSPSPIKKNSNPWIWVSVILAVVVIALLVIIFKAGGFKLLTGNSVGVTGDSAATDLVKYLNTKTGGGVTLVDKSVQDQGSLYQLKVKYQNQEIPVYVTKDGKYFVQGAVDMTGSDAAGADSNTPQATPTPADVPKTDKPVVQAFVFAYCPYGLQFEKALFPVYDLLKSKANISVMFIGAMHGEFEHVESLRQLCIEKNYGNDKLFSYLKEFDVSTDIGSCSGSDSCLTPLIGKIYTKLGIDKKKVDTCMANDAQKIYDDEGAAAQALGISGSPTFVINGVEVQVARTPSAIKDAVCNSFTKAPSECSKTVSTSSTTAGFGTSSDSGSTTGSASAASCGTA